jgi:ParB family chromosome partitioning protein
MGKKTLSVDIAEDFKSGEVYSFREKVEMLPVDKVLPNDKNFFPVNDEEVALLMEDIEWQGVKHNLVVKANGDGTYTIISGHKRREAVRRLVEVKGYTPILPCLVESYKSENEEKKALIKLNVTNRKLTDRDLMKSYEELRAIFEQEKSEKNVKGGIREIVAKALEVSNSQVRRIENINKHAIEEVKTLINEDKISINTADKIAVLDVEKQKEIVTNPDISALEEIKPNDIIKNCDVKDTIFDNKKYVLKDINSDTGNSADEVKNLVLKDRKPTNGNSYYSPEQIRKALELLAYKNDEITTILKCLEKNAR